MHRRRHDARLTLTLLGAAFALSLPGFAAADETSGEPMLLARVARPEEGYADSGADDCMDCHDEDAKYPVLPILATRHGVTSDERTPLSGDRACETCHGPSQAHADDEEVAPGLSFGPDTPASVMSEVCLGCHQGGERMGWAGSKHDLQNVACTSCHKVHVKEDPVLIRSIDPMVFAREGQTQVCFQCHADKRAQMQHRVSVHPLREGKVQCSDCHNPHGSMGPSMLARTTLNETCYQCHAEKRGPFLWEHAPVREDCSNCHQPHGSNHPNMLRARQPYLCQQCHMATRHPSTAYDGPDVRGAGGRRQQAEAGCRNCHTEVHGSNHPSGVRWIR
jgi:DmsE family decaheme c-type cytochrome